MRAIVYRETGSSCVLTLIDRDPGEPGPGEARVRLVRAGVNPTDWKFRTSTMGGYDEVTPGQDGAGVVDAVGTEVGAFAPGDRVWTFLAQHGRAHGAAAELVIVPADRLVMLPDDASFDLGAALGVPAITAHRALTVAEDGPTRLVPGALAGHTVLVAGGAGAVGNAAIQLARWAGATVVSTVSSAEKATLATAAGAHHTIDYTDGDESTITAIRDVVPAGVDIVVEVAPAQNNAVDLEVLKPHGTVAIYANNGGDDLVVPLRETFSKNLRYQFLILYTLDEPHLRHAAEDLSAVVAGGGFRIGEHAGLPLHHYPLEDLAAAQDAVEAGAVGKVLLDIAED